MLDVSHVECLGALHGEHVAGVVEVFGAAPAEFLDDDVLRRGKPGFAPDLRWSYYGGGTLVCKASGIMNQTEARKSLANDFPALLLISDSGLPHRTFMHAGEDGIG